MRRSESSRGLKRRPAIFALFSLCLLAELVLVVGSAAATDVVTLQASADTYLRSGAPNTNEGSSSFLRLRASGDNRALVRFDQTALQAAAQDRWLVSARLELTITHNANNWGPSGRTISVYRLTSPWEEGNGFVDQGSPPNRGAGSGATWECAVDANIANQARDCSGSTQWEMGKPNQPGLHPWVEPATASVLITNDLTGTISFDVTDNVDAFLSEASENFGWIVKKDVEGDPGLVEFASRESGSSGPRLILEFDTVAPDERYAPDDPDTGPEGVPGEFEGPGGGAEGYDPDVNPDSACDAYVDFGIPDWCLDPGAVDNPPASAAAALRAGVAAATAGELSSRRARP